MIKRLHLLVFKSYIGPLILTFFISEFVLMMHFLWLYIGDLVGKGLEWSIISELLLYASAGLVPLALPLAILLASIMTFGNMGEHFELTAMKSAGISLQKIMTPLIILSVIISIGAFFFSNNVLPYTNLKTGSLLYDVSHQRPELNIKPGIFNKDIEGYSIKIKEKNPDSPMMYGFMIYDHSEKRGNPTVSLADSGKMEITDDLKYMIVTLYHGRTYEELKEKTRRNKKYPEHNDEFEKQTIIFELASSDLERTDEALFKHNYQMKNLNELASSQDSLQQYLDTKKTTFVKGMNRSKYYKYARKISNYADTSQLVRDSVLRRIKPEQLEVIYNLDSIYDSFDAGTQQKVIEIAQDYAINSKKLITSTQKDLYQRKKNIQKHRIAWHEKFTLSFACLIFFFIGAPLGAIIRKGGFGLPFLVSIVFFLAYYVVTITGKKFATEGGWMAWEGMWLSSAFTLPIGVFLTYKATTDSVIFDFNTYLDFIKQPFKVYVIKYKDPDLVFYKDVKKTDKINLSGKIAGLLEQSTIILKQLKIGTSSHNKVYSWLLSKEFPNFETYVNNYNLLFENLSVQFRSITYIKTNLEKLPVIDYTKYEPTKKKRLANYILLTIFYFPIGVLLLYRSYLKLNVLRKKIELININLKTITDQIKDKN
ncbi:MAG: LptF/LptG family permease [Bacteroidota bacterium]